MINSNDKKIIVNYDEFTKMINAIEQTCNDLSSRLEDFKSMLNKSYDESANPCEFF